MMTVYDYLAEVIAILVKRWLSLSVCVLIKSQIIVSYSKVS